MSQSIEDRITSSLPEYKELIHILSQTADASNAIARQTALISSLITEASAADEQLAGLTATVEKERNDHLKYSSSTRRRARSLLRRKSAEKYAARADKEEQEYLSAVDEEQKFTQTRDALEKRLEAALVRKSQLEQDVKTHEETQSRLEQLYNSIFANATPGCPEEDAAEDAYSRAKTELYEVRGRLDVVEKTVVALSEATKAAGEAVKEVEAVEKRSRMEAFGLADESAAQEHLALAQSHLSTFTTKLADARRLEGDIMDVATPSIPDAHELSHHGALSRNLTFHEMVTGVGDECRTALRRAEEGLDECRTKRSALKKECCMKDRVVKETCELLVRIRGDIFGKIAGISNDGRSTVGLGAGTIG